MVEEIDKQKVLIVTSVEAEKEAVLRGLGDTGDIEVHVVGVGVVTAAVNTAFLLASKKYDVVINMGIAGGFNGKANVETVVIADELVAADLGAESKDGFLSLDELKLGSVLIPVDDRLTTSIKKILVENGAEVATGAVLTLSTVTGTAETADRLQKRYPNAMAEAMEGYGVGVAAKQMNIPIMEIRTISNMVGPRDRSAWKIKEALVALERASAGLKEVFK
ncbi:futalosine hydrolase [Halalkalibacter krulwichiae]|uniref:Futalosine hydrolase n=1 Tax=Halalkalibacter krulwichiae TaxID=199441 RepID=A0A1X9M7M7_9BACI|nr:futalosine hydrolase [Halalkalibacter krulwichiae]ARK28684.1 Futalosine hydrolase [Halalkalibacter krulwichiae]